MKTAGRENPNCWATAPNGADGAAGQSSSRSFKWAAQQENFQPQEKVFFLAGFIELIGTGDHSRVTAHWELDSFPCANGICENNCKSTIRQSLRSN